MQERVASLLRINPPAAGTEGLLMASGDTVPADDTSGYATGCIFQKTSTFHTAALYVNEGSDTSCDFNAITVA